MGVKDWFLGVTIGEVFLFIDLVTTVKCCLHIKILAEKIVSTRYNTQTNSFDSLSASKWRNLQIIICIGNNITLTTSYD